MNIYENNIKFLKKHYPNLLTMAYGSNKQLVHEHSTTKSNEPNLIIVKDNVSYNLHSKYNAVEDARKWALTLAAEQVHSEHILLLGCGLGYYLEQLMEHSTSSNIYVYEPDVQIFNAWLRNRDIRKVLSDRRIRLFVLGEDDLLQTKLTRQISVYAKESLYIAVPPIYNKLFQPIVSSIHHKVKESLYTQLVDQATLSTFQEEWLTNILYNLPHVIVSTSASKLQQLGKELTVIIVGSGPSLQHDIHFLYELKPTCLIIAAGSSIQALQHFGISPHIVVSIDGGIPNFRVFENVDTSLTPLLFCPQINYNILELYKGPLLSATLDHDSITPKLCASQELPLFRSSASVTGTAMQVAAYMGASRIVLMGQDLSYPGNQFYSAGVRHITVEGIEDHLKDATEWVPNVDGGQNPTTVKMKATLDDMELHIQLISLAGTQFINSSRHGAVITGTEWIPMSELVGQLLELPPHNFGENKYLTEFTVEEKVSNLSKVRLELELMRKETNNLAKHIDQLNTTMDILAGKLVGSNINSISGKLVEVDKLWSRITRQKVFQVFYSFALRMQIDRYMKYVSEIVETEDVRMKSKLIVNQLGALVREMDEFTPKLLRILGDSMDRLDNYIDKLGEL